jgi:SAM-dependent methyltransferase
MELAMEQDARKNDGRRSAPATLRNRDPILDVLRPVLPDSGLVLEVASGTGEHAVYFAEALPALRWQPSDPSPDARASIAAWAAAARLGNVLPPLDLDAGGEAWPIGRADAVLCINMIHISPWAATEGLMRGAGSLLGPGQPLYLYGPYRHPGHPIEPSNAMFDADLRLRDERWGLRDLGAVTACARASGLALESVIEMPANNLSVIFRKR